MLLENIRTALEALLDNRQRTLLTLLGVIIGVFAVTTTISMGEIATAGIIGELESVGSQQIWLEPDYENPQSDLFTEEDIEALSRLPIEVSKQQGVGGLASTATADKTVGFSVDGVTFQYPDFDGTMKLSQGRYFTEAEERVAAPVMVLSADAAEALFKDKDPVGEEVRVTVGESRSLYTVIGVKERVTGALGALGANNAHGDVPISAFYISYPFVERGVFDYLPISIDLDQNVDDVEKQIRSIMNRRRGETTYKVQKVEGLLDTFNMVTTILQVVLGGIGAVSLLVGGIGILNIMLVSVTERTREIGLRKALGAKKGTILQQFLIEAVVLTVLGGLLGIVLAVTCLYLIVALVPFLDEVIISPFVVFLAFGVSALTGIIFGLLPANRAANLSPIEALRYE